MPSGENLPQTAKLIEESGAETLKLPASWGNGGESWGFLGSGDSEMLGVGDELRVLNEVSEVNPHSRRKSLRNPSIVSSGPPN